MESVVSKSSSDSIRIQLPLVKAIKAWALLSAGLLVLQLFDSNWTIKSLIAGLGKSVIAAAVLLIAQLVLSLLMKPLSFNFNYQAGTFTYVRLGFPWKRTVTLSQMNCRLAKQQAHNGETHYLLLFQQGAHLLAMQESYLWPLAALQQLERCIQEIEK